MKTINSIAVQTAHQLFKELANNNQIQVGSHTITSVSELITLSNSTSNEDRKEIDRLCSMYI